MDHLNKAIRDLIINLENTEKITENDEDNLKQYKQSNEILDKIFSETESLSKQLTSLKTDDFSEQLSTFYIDILIRYNNNLEGKIHSYPTNLLDKYNSILNLLTELQKEIIRIDYLSYVKDKNIVLVGGNGVGKSSFASYLKNSLSDNIVVIPAQKFLFFDLNISGLHLTKKSDVNSIQKENLIEKGKIIDKNDKYAVKRHIDNLSSMFSKFITLIANEQIIEQNNILNTISTESKIVEMQNQTILSKLNSLWENLVPDIKFKLNTTNRILIPVKNGEEYDLNSMSDGEKAILYYISYVLLAEDNSFIVVDEPETFLNASNFNRLWDTLEDYRDDCKFIYISHTVDFIVSRDNADLLWCKNFDYPTHWEIERIDAESELAEEFPRELLSELLGARKPILFCEGTKSSLDYSIYSSLFKGNVIVYPVGGHNEVIEYTKSYNRHSSKLNGSKAVGIIDADLMSYEQIEKYKNNSIYTLEFNEIEMLLFSEEVMYKVLTKTQFTESEAEERINNFKLSFITTMSERIDKVLFERKKKYIDYQLSNYRINKSKNSEDIFDELKIWVDNLITNDIFEQFKVEINELIEELDFEKLLKICPLKTEISKNLANQKLGPNYQETALHRIKIDKNLSEDIKSLHFSDLESEIMSLS